MHCPRETRTIVEREREREVKLSLSTTKTTPAVDETEKPAPSTKTKSEAAAAASSGDPPKGNPKAKAKCEAASVLPTPSPKSHADKKSKKGREKGRSSSPTDKKKIFCNYFFNKGGCNKGDKCLYSHSQKVYNAEKEEAEAEIRRKGKGREALHLLDQRRRHFGNGRRGLVQLGASVISFMLVNRRQRLLKDPTRKPRRRQQPLLPLIPSLTATTKILVATPHPGSPALRNLQTIAESHLTRTQRCTWWKWTGIAKDFARRSTAIPTRPVYSTELGT